MYKVNNVGICNFYEENTMNDGDFVIFREEQKSGHWLMRVIAISLAIFVWSLTIREISHETDSGLLSYFSLFLLIILLGISFPYYVFIVKQVTEVRNNELCIYTDPFKYGLVKFPLEKIKYCGVRKLSLSRDNRIGAVHVGGSGYGSGTNIPANEFIAKGNNIVEVEFNNGSKIKIGTQRPDELARVLSNGTNYRHMNSKIQSCNSQKQYLKLAYMIVFWILFAAVAYYIYRESIFLSNL